MKQILTLPFCCIFLSILVFGLPQKALSQIVINEYSCSNFETFQDNFQQYEDWLELYNTSSASVDLGGYYLSDNVDVPKKWEIPAGTVIPGNGFLKFWLSGRDTVSGESFHTNFKLTQTKAIPEMVLVSNPSGTILDQQQLSITQKEHSNGRITDGNEVWGVFTTPTPGAANTTAAFTRYAEKPSMSLTGGFYNGSIAVSISTTEPNSTIRFTTNGNEPVSTSGVYSTPITVSATKIVKARVFSNNATILPSLIEFNTYFLNEDYSLPVVSIAGTNLTQLLNGNGNITPWGSIEYYGTDKIRTAMGYGEFDKHGQDSWVHPQRSLDYKMRDECGYNFALIEPLFRYTDRDEYQKFILRACGDDNYPGIDSSAHIRDDFVQTLSVQTGMSLDERKSSRCIVFANGAYWGVYSIREKPNDHDFTKYYYDQDKFNIYYLMLWGSTWAEYGGQAAFDDWGALYNYIMTHNLAIQSNYNYVADRYDVTSLVDYMLLNSYVVCSDWLNWNVAWWKGLNPDGGHKKWGYMLWDEDAVFGHYINYTGIPAQTPYVEPCFQDDITGSSDPEGHVKVLNRLRQNADFEQYYVSRYADLLNTAFNPSYMIPLLDSLAAIIEPEMPKHYVRWGGSSVEWSANVQKIRNFINERYNFVKNGLTECYSLTGPYQIQVTVDPPGAGEITLNSLTLKNFPWAGSYYGNIDTKFSVIESNQQYKFSHWQVNHNTIDPSDTAKNMKLRLTENDEITAVFEARIFSDSLVINEINYNSSASFDPGDWVEFYNPQNHPLDISNWVFKDEDDLHAFVFEPGTVIEPDGYLVLSFDPIAFHNLFPDVTNFVGPMGFGLSGSGELIRVFDDAGTLVDTVHYFDHAPWPLTPDGEGATLELISPYLDNALAQSWKGSEIPPHGTPGESNNLNVDLDNGLLSNLGISVRPNPFKVSAVFIVDSQKEIKDATLEIFSLTGQKMMQVDKINSNQFVINRNGLQAGCYFFRLTDKSGKLSGSGKVLVAD